MELLKRKPSLMLFVVTALLVLLPLLAVLQYRWLGEVSAGERERMQVNLKTSADRFCADFDRELTNVYLQLQNAGGATSHQMTSQPASQAVDELVVRYRKWLATSSRPKLIQGLYRTSFDGNEQLALLRFNPSSNLFEPAEWPENMHGLRDKMEAQRQYAQSTQTILRTILGPNPAQRQEQLQARAAKGFVFQISLGQIADDVPALVIPDAGPHAPTPTITSIMQEKRICTIALLDLDYIKKELIPELAQRYFTNEGRNDYNLVVARRSADKEVIYQTDSQLPVNAFEQSDAKSSLFRIRPEEVDRIIVAGLPAPTSSSMTSHPVHSAKDGKAFAVIKEEQATGTYSAEPKGVSVRVLQSETKVSKASDGKGEQILTEDLTPRQIIKRMDEGGWQLSVKHRAGSLDAAVGSVRRRNLAISFGILLLLGVSVGFIVMSSRRAQRLATQQMEFVAGVSHELRTPLAVICSAAENLADGVPGLVDNRDSIKRYGGLIRDEGRRLTAMVEQVLEFAGAQSGKKTYELRPTELNRVIDDAIAACHLQLVEGGFELEKQIVAEPPMINADAAALSRAIQNLLNNAMKYSGESHWIGLYVETVKTDRGNEVQIKVSDRGLGIPSSELPHIFEPFYRGKEVVASQIHGNGLGLSLVKHIVEAHGGQVSIESRSGQGSAFKLYLPSFSMEQFSASTAQETYEQTNFAR